MVCCSRLWVLRTQLIARSWAATHGQAVAHGVGALAVFLEHSHLVPPVGLGVEGEHHRELELASRMAHHIKVHARLLTLSDKCKRQPVVHVQAIYLHQQITLAMCIPCAHRHQD